MKMVYTHENRFFVSNAKNILEAKDIPVLLKNEYAAGAAGDLSPFDTWMELWVYHDEDYEKAIQLIETAFNKNTEPDWVCTQCKETNVASFELCWQCQQDR